MEVSDDEIGNSAWLTSRRRSRWRNQGARWTRWTRAAAAVRTLIADIKCVSVAACCRAKYLGNLGGTEN